MVVAPWRCFGFYEMEKMENWRTSFLWISQKRKEQVFRFPWRCLESYEMEEIENWKPPGAWNLKCESHHFCELTRNEKKKFSEPLEVLGILRNGRNRKLKDTIFCEFPTNEKKSFESPMVLGILRTERNRKLKDTISVNFAETKPENVFRAPWRCFEFYEMEDMENWKTPFLWISPETKRKRFQSPLEVLRILRNGRNGCFAANWRTSFLWILPDGTK